jgi:tetratricopeptide (TPR) repeat protein
VSLTLTNEIKSLTGKFKADSLAHRIYFVEDAFNMVKERPLFGWGGGGWQEAYRYFQSYGYNSTQVHSHYIQVAVETGIAGLLAIAGLWMSFLLALFRAYRKKDRLLTTFLGVCALIFGIHAAVDFDLSLSALSLVLYTTMAIIRNVDRGIYEQDSEPVRKGAKGRIGLAINASAGLIILILLIPILSAQYCYNEAMSFYKQKDVDKALIYMQKSAFYDPFYSEYHVALSDVYRLTGKLDMAMDEMNEALLRSKYNPDIRTRLANIALQQGDYQNAVKYAEEAIEMAPWQISYYELAGSTYNSIGLIELKNKRFREADKYISLAIKLPNRVQDKRKGLDPFKQKNSYSLGITPKFALTTGISNFLMGNIKEASANLKRASGDKDLKGEAYVWLSLLSEKQGDTKSAEKYLNEANKISQQLENTYNELKHLLQ